MVFGYKRNKFDSCVGCVYKGGMLGNWLIVNTSVLNGKQNQQGELEKPLIQYKCIIKSGVLVCFNDLNLKKGGKS